MIALNLRQIYDVKKNSLSKAYFLVFVIIRDELTRNHVTESNLVKSRICLFLLKKIMKAFFFYLDHFDSE